MWRYLSVRVSRNNARARIAYSELTWRRLQTRGLWNAPASAKPAAEVVQVPCGSNGSISLHIHHAKAVKSFSPLAIVYLPPGPFLATSYEHDHEPVARILSERADATVIQVNYRLSNEYRFPTPIHDVLFGYDWVLDNLMGRKTTRGAELAMPLGVCGELIGGGLASMLALTECHTNGPRVSAAAVHSPVLDWVFPETYAEHGTPASNQAEHSGRTRRQVAGSSGIEDEDSITDLLRSRGELFRSAQDWFDPFASPTLFFRTAGVDVPSSPSHAVVDDFDDLRRLHKEEDALEQRRRTQATDEVDVVSDDFLADSGGKIRKPRRAARRYPKVDSCLTLPKFCITSANTGMLNVQCQEFARYVRRSMVRTDETAKEDSKESLLRAAQDVLHIPLPGSNYWHRGWTGGVSEIAKWFRQVL